MEKLADNFQNLERWIKKVVTTILSDLSHLLTHVEDRMRQKRQDIQGDAVKGLHEQVPKLAKAHRSSLFK